MGQPLEFVGASLAKWGWDFMLGNGGWFRGLMSPVGPDPPIWQMEPALGIQTWRLQPCQMDFIGGLRGFRLGDKRRLMGGPGSQIWEVHESA